MTSSPDSLTSSAQQFARHLLKLYPQSEVRRVIGPHHAAYAKFGERYYGDVSGFMRDCVRCPEPGFAPYQLDIAQATVDHERVAARGLRGFGKTAVAANVILHFALTRDALGVDWKAIMTASVWRQLTAFLAPEIHLWAGRLRWNMIGREPFDGRELMLREIRLDHGAVMPIASNNPETAEGGHASELLYVYDEAKIIPEAMWDSTEGAFSTGRCRWLAISTPGAPAGRFYDIMSHKPHCANWWTRRVTVEEALDAGRVSASWVEQRRVSWGEDSVLYRQQVLGEFAADTEGAIIPLAWIEAAQERWRDWAESGRLGRVTHIGFDVGGGFASGDRSTIVLVYGGVTVGEIIKIEQAADPEVATMELAGRIQNLAQKHSPQWITGDTIGLGAGVVHRLREMGLPAIGFQAGAGTNLTDASGLQGFANWRAAGWLTLRDALNPKDGLALALPPDDDLTGELTAPKVKSMSSLGKVTVESKEEIKRRIGRSTDCADAVIHALIGPALAREQQTPKRQVVWRGR